MLRKQKKLSLRRTSVQIASNLALVLEYRASIVPVQFSLREVQTYESFSNGDLQNIEISMIQHQKLKELVVDSLKLSFIYDPLKQCLELSTFKYINHYQLKNVIKILYRSEFYRFIYNTENHLKLLVNNRTTEANVKILIAALFIFATKKLSLDQISTALLFFQLEATLNPDPLCIPADSQKIIKVLKKIERVIKPNEFKLWLEAVKNSKQFCGQIEAHQFLYLCSISERKLFSHGFHHLLLQPNMASLFKNLNINVKASDFQTADPKEVMEKKKIVKGLDFVEPKQRHSFSFSKEILKEFRLRNPSKNKRPDTSNLRRRVQSFCKFPEGKSWQNSPQQPKIFLKNFSSNYLARKSFSRKPSESVVRLTKGSSKLKKPQFRLRLF